jgi:PTS system beta-glucosides-specific IIC component
MLASNVAMGAATLCVALKTKNSSLRQLASSSGFTALLGITEPALYGVLLKFRRVLIAAMIGGGCAGLRRGERAGALRVCLARPGGAAGVYRRKPDEHRPCAGDLRDFHRGDLYPDLVYRLQRCSRNKKRWARRRSLRSAPKRGDGSIKPAARQVVALSEVNDDVFPAVCWARAGDSSAGRGTARAV